VAASPEKQPRLLLHQAFAKVALTVGKEKPAVEMGQAFNDW
jgi:hypothetical protein